MEFYRVFKKNLNIKSVGGMLMQIPSQLGGLRCSRNGKGLHFVLSTALIHLDVGYTHIFIYHHKLG